MDAALPQLDLALDGCAMAAVLAAECLDRRFEVRDCRIGHVRYKPGRNCLIGYELTLRDRDRGAEFPQILCGRVYGAGMSEQRWRKALAQPLDAVSTGAPVTHIERMDMVVWAFPNERKLRGLGALLDDAKLVAETLPRVLGRPWVRFAKSELVRYIPEHGCTVRVRVDTGAGLRVLYAKAYADGAGAVTFERMKQIPGARPVAWEDGVLWQEEVPGTAIGASEPLGPCARALARLHQTRVAGLASVETDWGRAREHAVAAALDSTGFDSLVRELERRREETLPAVTLHGDLHLKNFLLHDGEAALIDLDTLRRGDPLEDVGSFLASLYHQGAAESRIQEFIDAYRECVPWPVAERALAWHTARALICERALRAITRRKGDTPRVFAELVDLARGLLERTQTARDVMRRFEQVVREVPGTPIDVHYKTYRKQKSWNKSYVTVSFRNAAGEIEVRREGYENAAWRFPHDPVVPWMAEAIAREGAEILNYRPENRCTWRFPSAGGVVYAKTYSDGRGAAVHQRLNALWEASQSGGSAFPMPQPMGYEAGIKTVFQAAYEGEPLVDRLGNRELLKRAAERLAFLHESGIEVPERFPLAAQLADGAKKMAKLAVVLPSMEVRLNALIGRLETAMPGLSEVPMRVVHGDFHLRQLMVRGEEVALFDFDELGWGDPVEDFGHFAADLESCGAGPEQVASLNAMLLEGYQRAAGWQIPADRLAWHVTLQLLTRAYRALLQLKPDFESRVERLVGLAEART